MCIAVVQDMTTKQIDIKARGLDLYLTPQEALELHYYLGQILYNPPAKTQPQQSLYRRFGE